MKYRIRTQQFCSLSKEAHWQNWLYTVAVDLHKDLMEHIEKSTSCRTNHIKMMEIHAKLEQRKLVHNMVKFLRKNYPHTVEEVADVESDSPIPFAPPSKILESITEKEVFAHYKPGLLTFPQKAVMENDDVDALKRDVHNFLATMINGDYIIIGNRAYVEYFKLKFSKESQEIKLHDREVYQYRVKHGLGALERVVVREPQEQR